MRDRLRCGWLGTVLLAIGETDCELIHSGLLAQPVNTLTSLAFVVVGLAVATRGSRARTTAAVGFAALLVAVGLGSLMFHGPQPSGSRFLHDTPIHLLLGFVVLHRLDTSRRATMQALVVIGAGSVLVVSATPASASALTAVLAAAALLVEARWQLRRSGPWRERRLSAAMAGVLAVAGACFLLGRTGAPTCDPLGLLQFHGLWHVSAAMVFGLWWWQLEPARPRPSAEEDPPRAPARFVSGRS